LKEKCHRLLLKKGDVEGFCIKKIFSSFGVEETKEGGILSLMAESALARKLHLKPGMKAAVSSAPPGYIKQLSIEAEQKLAGAPDAGLDFVQVKSVKEIENAIPGIKKALKNDGLPWITYPKGGAKAGTDLNRDILWALMEKYQLAGMAMVSIDDVRSAMRFRPSEKVGK
jgi:hypothetical protein